jgi:hypothetical protein
VPLVADLVTPRSNASTWLSNGLHEGSSLKAVVETFGTITDSVASAGIESLPKVLSEFAPVAKEQVGRVVSEVASKIQ